MVLLKRFPLSKINSFLFFLILLLWGGCRNQLQWDAKEISKTRLNQLGHFLYLLSEKGQLPPSLEVVELNQRIYSAFSREVKENRYEINYYNESLGFQDGWGRALRLMRHPGYCYYSFGANGIDDWGQGDDLVAKRVVMASK